ncbi:hypothetical protein L1887_51921 [Cichorium endivia]|nr:hypothetical protein L1887_51921 [Cichorium endivia]
MSRIDHGGAEKQVQLKLSLLGIVPKTETDEHPRCALRMQSRSGWGEWGRWRQQQPIRLCPIDAADGWDGMARVPPTLRLGKNTISTKKPAAERSGVAWRLARRAEPIFFGWGKKGRVASRSPALSVVVCGGGRASQEPKRVCFCLLRTISEFFFFLVARWKLLSRKLSSIFFFWLRARLHWPCASQRKASARVGQCSRAGRRPSNAAAVALAVLALALQGKGNMHPDARKASGQRGPQRERREERQRLVHCHLEPSSPFGCAVSSARRSTLPRQRTNVVGRQHRSLLVNLSQSPAFFGAPLLRRELSFGLAGIDLPLHLIFTPSSPCLRRRPLPSSRTLTLRNTSTPPSRRLDCNPHCAKQLATSSSRSPSPLDLLVQSPSCSTSRPESSSSPAPSLASSVSCLPPLYLSAHLPALLELPRSEKQQAIFSSNANADSVPAVFRIAATSALLLLLEPLS